MIRVSTKTSDEVLSWTVMGTVFRALQSPCYARSSFSWPKFSHAEYDENSLCFASHLLSCNTPVTKDFFRSIRLTRIRCGVSRSTTSLSQVCFLYLTKNSPSQISWNGSWCGLQRHSVTEDLGERVIRFVLDVVFHALQNPYHSWASNSQQNISGAKHLDKGPSAVQHLSSNSRAIRDF